MFKNIRFLFLILAFFLAPQVLPGANGAKSEILSILDNQKAMWNSGDLAGFMAYYWNSEELTFQSAGLGRLHGWQALLERYERTYPGENRGTLDFTDLEVQALAADSAYVLGNWRLSFPDGSTRGGLFTLILRRLPEGWRIIHDHTS